MVVAPAPLGVGSVRGSDEGVQRVNVGELGDELFLDLLHWGRWDLEQLSLVIGHRLELLATSICFANQSVNGLGGSRHDEHLSFAEKSVLVAGNRTQFRTVETLQPGLQSVV
ncbi:MAG: hypothetical protein JWN70_6386 [Planctomycetaceae bacterium]|nr:hypothetical protein [Planctomycetaceae bacterium]